MRWCDADDDRGGVGDCQKAGTVSSVVCFAVMLFAMSDVCFGLQTIQSKYGEEMRGRCQSCNIP